MAVQANYDGLVTALAATSEVGIDQFGSALLAELKAAPTVLPAGGALADPEVWSASRGVKNLVRSINHMLGF